MLECLREASLRERHFQEPGKNRSLVEDLQSYGNCGLPHQGLVPRLRTFYRFHAKQYQTLVERLGPQPSSGCETTLFSRLPHQFLPSLFSPILFASQFLFPVLFPGPLKEGQS